jgi:urease accessory protein
MEKSASAILASRIVLADLAPGHASIALRRAGSRTVLARAAAASPLRLLTPRNHGDGAWVYLASLGGGLVDGDHLEIQVDAAEDTTGLLGTQASTKVYRSPRGCSQRLDVHVARGAAMAIVPDPVVCFAQARYSQEIAVSLDAGASLLLLDGYVCGRSARGERWRFDSFRSRTTILRGGMRTFVDATYLDPTHGPLADRMGRFDAVLSLLAMGPRFSGVGDVMRDASSTASSRGAIVAVSRVGADATLLRVAGECFEDASRPLRASFSALAGVLGDDPFARKW